jgi:hypothetical protein
MAILSTLRQRRLIKVFIASPGDLIAERQSAHEVVKEINAIFGCNFDMEIDLLGWEDTLPGMGRPQAMINRDVDGCDLFIGLLWKRWARPQGKNLPLVSRRNLNEQGSATSVQDSRKSGWHSSK